MAKRATSYRWCETPIKIGNNFHNNKQYTCVGGIQYQREPRKSSNHWKNVEIQEIPRKQPWKFIDELINYYNNNSLDGNKTTNDPKRGLKDLKDVSYKNPYEAYLITQIKLVESLPSVIDEHIIMLNIGDDIDTILESFKSNVYHIKKDIYSNLGEWEVLIEHIDNERISEITCNPKWYGDLLLKELLWIRKCEEKQTIMKWIISYFQINITLIFKNYICLWLQNID